jgi:FKBP-type peptidyl-prolyl cis-trans isomerase FklB
MVCQDFVPGFTTALMNMHIGDRWRVYIPYQLGYGSLAKPTCSYSNLIFDVALVDFWHPGEHRPVFKSR